MAPAFVQDLGYHQLTSTNTVTLTTPSVTAGDTLVITARWNSAGQFVTSITDGHNTYTPVPNTLQQNASLADNSLQIWTATAVTGGVLSIVLTVTSSVSALSLKGAEFSGVTNVYGVTSNFFAIDQFNSQQSTTSATVTTPTITTTQANEALYASFSVNSVTISTPTNWNALTNNQATFYYDFWRIVSSTGSFACTTTASTIYDAAIVSLVGSPATIEAFGNAGASGVTITWTGPTSGSTTSASDGSFVLTGLSAGTYTITPTLTGATFNPSSATQVIGSVSVTGVNFQPNFNWWTNEGTVIASVSSSIPEQPNVIFEGNAQILSGNVFKIWYTTGAPATPTGINYAESTDGKSWTQYSSNPVIASRWGTRVFKNGSTYWLSCETDFPATAIQVYTSSDGIHWTQQNATAITTGSGGAWDNSAVGQMSVVAIVSGTWYAYYWGTNSSTTTTFNIGLATSSDGINWTKGGSNPLSAFTSGTLVNGQNWNGAAAPGFITSGSTYYAYGQVVPASFPGAVADIPNELMMWSATNPAGPWTAISTFPLYRTISSEGVGVTGSNGGQIADPSILYVPSLNNIYLWYTANSGGGNNYNINLAIAQNTTLSALLASNQGIVNVPLDGEPSVNLNTVHNGSTDFSGSNNPLGGQWLQRFNGASYCNIKTVSGVVEAVTAADNSDAYWNGTAWHPNHWSQITIGACSSSSFIGVFLRGSLNSATNSAYRLYWTGSTGSAGTIKLDLVNNNTTTNLYSQGSLTMNIGDTILGLVIGSKIGIYWNGLLLDIVSDSTLATGVPGLWVAPEGGGTATATISAWSGGNFVPSSPTAPPSTTVFPNSLMMVGLGV